MKRDILQNWHLYQISSLNTTKYCMSRSCYLPALFDIQLSSRQTWTLWTLYVMTDNNTANNVVLLYLSTLGNNIAYNWNNICSTRYYLFNIIRLILKYHALFQRQLHTLIKLILEEYGETFVACLIYKQTTTLCEINREANMFYILKEHTCHTNYINLFGTMNVILQSLIQYRCPLTSQYM